MGHPNSKPQSNDESKHHPSSSQTKKRNNKSVAKNNKVVTEHKRESASKDKTNPDETKDNHDLIVASVASRLQQYAVNINFLQNIIGMPHVLTLLIFQYVSFYDQNIVNRGLIYVPGQRNLLPSLGIFKMNESSVAEYVPAEVIAYDHVLPAGPLAGLEKEVRKNPDAVLQLTRTTMTLDGVIFTFDLSPLQLAMALLDQTIQAVEDSTVPMTDQGQAEKLMDLIAKLMPERMSEAREQARSAAPIEDEKTSKAKEEERSNVLNAAFNQIKINNFDIAGKIIMAYIINTKPAVITDNRYFLNLLKLIPMAFNLLLTRAKELKNGLYGDQADQFCFRIIGTIERVLPPKLRKVLGTGLYYLLYQGRNIDRTMDVLDTSYLTGDGWELSFNRYFDDTAGRECGGRAWLSQREFSKLLSAITSAQQNLCSDRTLSQRAIP